MGQASAPGPISNLNLSPHDGDGDQSTSAKCEAYNNLNEEKGESQQSTQGLKECKTTGYRIESATWGVRGRACVPVITILSLRRQSKKSVVRPIVRAH